MYDFAMHFMYGHVYRAQELAEAPAYTTFWQPFFSNESILRFTFWDLIFTI